MSLHATPVLSQEVQSQGRFDHFTPMLRTAGVLGISLLVIIPCLWQPHIQASDLPSHLYNAWLVNLIRDNSLPGLYLVPQYSNVLFDWLLEIAMRFGGTTFAERACCSAAVLAFFWGTLLFLCSVNRGVSVTAAAWVAVIAYGAVFRLGFINFYISVGLALAAGALVLRRPGLWACAAVPLAALAFLAHALPVIWVAAIVSWIWLHAKIQKSLLLLACAIAVVATIAVGTAPTFGAGWEFARSAGGLPALLGMDQVLIFGPRYFVIAIGLVALLTYRFLNVLEGTKVRSLIIDVRFQLLVVHALAVLLFPVAIATQGRPFTYIPQRLSLLTAITALIFYFSFRPSRTEKWGLYTLTALFFLFAFVDDRALNRFENNLTDVVRQLPPGERVVAPLREPVSRTPILLHMIDRACIGHCYSYGNYEPASTHFRVRVAGPNAYAVAAGDLVWALENGRYRVQSQGVPLNVIGVCRDPSRLCIIRARIGDLVPVHAVRVLPDF